MIMPKHGAEIGALCVTTGVKLIKNHRFEIIEAAG
jgi:hypothetical protein